MQVSVKALFLSPPSPLSLSPPLPPPPSLFLPPPSPPLSLYHSSRYRKKFVLHAERLHSCHNNYSLAVLNANVHQDYFQASLLPFILDTLQHRMELNISQW